MLGFKFYPVSFWYCFHADGTPLAVLAGVQNTFRDPHNYLLHNHGRVYYWKSRPEQTKAFYVSPFIQLDDVRTSSRSAPGDTLAVSIYDYVAGPSCSPLTRPQRRAPHRRVSGPRWAHGADIARALVLIYWQALRSPKRVRCSATRRRQRRLRCEANARREDRRPGPRRRACSAAN